MTSLYYYLKYRMRKSHDYVLVVVQSVLLTVGWLSSITNSPASELSLGTFVAT